MFAWLHFHNLYYNMYIMLQWFFEWAGFMLGINSAIFGILVPIYLISYMILGDFEVDMDLIYLIGFILESSFVFVVCLLRLKLCESFASFVSLFTESL